MLQSTAIPSSSLSSILTYGGLRSTGNSFIIFTNSGRAFSNVAFISLPYFLGVILRTISAVSRAKSFRAPPLTASRLIIACFSIEFISSASAVLPDAFGNTPACPTSGLKLPYTLPLDKSLLFSRRELASCLITVPSSHGTLVLAKRGS